MTHLELEEKIFAGDEKVTAAQSLVMIQCVGCRNEERNYCSRMCCSESIKNALKLKEINPNMDIYILFRDMRTYGFKEDYYREAANKGVRFIRYEPEEPPQVEPGESEDGRPVLKVTATDYVLGKKLELDADIVALAAAVVPFRGQKRNLRVVQGHLGPGRLLQGGPCQAEAGRLRGGRRLPLRDSPLSQAYTGNGQPGLRRRGPGLTLLANDTVVASGSVCAVDEDKCISCGACISACTYGAIEFCESPQGRKARVTLSFARATVSAIRNARQAPSH